MAKNEINWEYCECGCHGHKVSVGSINLWLYNDLKGNFYLHEGHGSFTSKAICVRSTWEDANKAAVEFLKKQIEFATMDLEKMKAVVGE